MHGRAAGGSIKQIKRHSMRTLRSILDDGALGMLGDIIRAHFTDPDLGETTLFRILDLDVEEPSLDLSLARDIATWIADGTVLPGFMTSLWTFLYSHGAMRNGKSGSGITPDFSIFEAATDTHDFFMWLACKPRTVNEAYQRWPRETADRLWRYFKADRLRPYGYTITVEARDGEEVIGIIRCPVEATVASGG